MNKIIITLLINFYFYMPALAQKSLDSLLGKEAPNFILETIDGNKIDMESLKGDIVVLNFWFLGCRPCLNEMPELNNLVQKYKLKSVKFIAISTKGSRENIQKLLNRRTFLYEIIASDLQIAKLYHINFYPTNIVIDKKGIIRSITSGFLPNTSELLIEAIDKALKEE